MKSEIVPSGGLFSNIYSSGKRKMLNAVSHANVEFLMLFRAKCDEKWHLYSGFFIDIFEFELNEAPDENSFVVVVNGDVCD